MHALVSVHQFKGAKMGIARKNAVAAIALSFFVVGCGALGGKDGGIKAEEPAETEAVDRTSSNEAIEVGLVGQAFSVKDGLSFHLSEDPPTIVEAETIGEDEEEVADEGSVDDEEPDDSSLALMQNKDTRKQVAIRKKKAIKARIDRKTGRYALKPKVKDSGSYVIITQKGDRGTVHRRAFVRVLNEKDKAGKSIERARNLDGVTTKVADMLEPYLKSVRVQKVEANFTDDQLLKMKPEEQLVTLLTLGAVNEAELTKTAQTLEKQNQARLSLEQARKYGLAAIQANVRALVRARQEARKASLLLVGDKTDDEAALKVVLDAYRKIDLKLTDKSLVSKFDSAGSADWLKLIAEANKSLSKDKAGSKGVFSSLMETSSSQVFSLIPSRERDGFWEKLARGAAADVEIYKLHNGANSSMSKAQLAKTIAIIESKTKESTFDFKGFISGRAGYVNPFQGLMTKATSASLRVF